MRRYSKVIQWQSIATACRYPALDRSTSQRNLSTKHSLTLPSSSLGRRYSTAYECSVYSDIDVEKIIVERSVKAGCRTIITRSRNIEDFIQIYELLGDVMDEIECSLDAFTLGHIVTSNGDTDKAMGLCISELTAIRSTTKLYRKRGLDFVFLPVQLLSCRDDDGLDYRIHKECTEQLRTLSASHLAESIGVDLTTSFLTTCTDSQLRSIVDNVLGPVFSEGSVSGLTIACNPFTSSRASTVLDCIQDLNSSAVLPNGRISIVATETLRSHNVRPGQLVTGGTFQPAHRMTVDSSPSSSDSSTSGDCPLRKKQLGLIDRAAKDFQVAMDRCMQVESVYLEKISSLKTVDGLAATDVCIAHVLASTYRQFQHPEEWAYVHRTKIEPRLQKGLKLLSVAGPEQADWCAIYQPMAKYLTASFRHLLQEQSMLMSIDTLSVLRAVDSPTPTDKALTDLAGHMSQFVLSWAKTDHVAVGGALAGELLPATSMKSDAEYSTSRSESTMLNEQLMRLYTQYYC